MYYVGAQKELERAAIYLRNSPVKLEDMVDECEDYINSLRNLAIEVRMTSFLPPSSSSVLVRACSQLSISYFLHLYVHTCSPRERGGALRSVFLSIIIIIILRWLP